MGTATIDTPLQPAPVRGPIYLAQNGAGPLPGLMVLLPPPLGLRLDAAIEVGSFGTRNVFPSNPDLPVRTFTFEFDGGEGGALKLTDDLCDEQTDTTIGVDLLSHSGRRSRFDTQLATPGCDPRAKAALRRRGRRAKLVARLTAARGGPAMTAAWLRLPRTLGAGRTKPLVYPGRQRLRPTSRSRFLSLRFPTGARSAAVVWRGLRASRRLEAFTHVGVTTTDSRGRTTKLRPEAPVRRAPRRRG